VKAARAARPMALPILSLLGIGPAAAQSRWERQVTVGFQRASQALRQEGYVETDTRYEFVLNTSETSVFALALQSGEAYVLVGICDEDCVGLELAMFAENDYEIEAARRPTNAPILRTTPRDSAPYRVQVVMAACRLNPCWAGVALYHRAADNR
jgi:hypothetical protein